ncbi:uncharacterized protein [Rutidosis leptorrhynchoides]|uniref:uncharacterized protein n=1 Tax=Rutidosis leptorrhynchoides TaxID=125765 RepID=UPI003A99FBA2
MATPEYLGIQCYINGLPNEVRRDFILVNPSTIQEAACMVVNDTLIDIYITLNVYLMKRFRAFNCIRSIMKNTRKITCFFSKRTSDNPTTEQESKRYKASTSAPEHEQNQPDTEPNVSELPKLNTTDFDITSTERDQGKRTQMWEYPANLREQIRLRYLNLGPLQVNLNKYPYNRKHDRRFRFAWFSLFPNWLEYSIKDSAYCFLCYLFNDKPNVRHGYDAFTVTGFGNWKKVNDGNNCAFLRHIRSSQHRYAVASSEDKEGVIRERFLNLVHVYDTCSLTLKTNLWNQLLHYQFDTQKIRGQGYDGASNMRGEWNGLQALIANDCPYAYYVHCFAHRLQLALVASSKEVIPVHKFLTKLTSIINVVCASSKRHDELQKSKADEIKCLLELGEIKYGKGKNQVGTMRRASDTRWGSHFKAVCSLIDMYDATFTVLRSIIKYGCSPQRGDADATYDYMKSFEFVLILHLIKEIMGMTDTLSQALQKKSQDIGNAIELFSATKENLNNFRNSGWNYFLEQVITFSEKHQVDIPDFKALYKSTRYRPREHDNQVSVEHYYKVDIFICTLDKQLHEMENRFNNDAMGLITLTSALVPKRILEACDINQICHLVKKYYPLDFTEQERIRLRYQLELFDIELSKNSKLHVTTTIAELCKTLVETRKCEMSDEFLADNLVVNIERDIAERYDS